MNIADDLKSAYEDGYEKGFADGFEAGQRDVQPERKRGKWVDGWSSGFDGARHWFRECSVCGYGRDDDNPEKDTNFCPDCGADMRGEKE